MQTALNGIVDGIRTIFSSTLSKAKSELITMCDDAGMSLTSNQKELLDKAMDNAVDPFKEIGTRYLQDKYMQENLDYLVR